MIEIVTALIRNERGHILLVRKRGTECFMQPGGKREEGESDLVSLARELDEELGCTVLPETARLMGVFSAPAAHEPGRTVRASIYAVGVSGTLAPRAEIDELLWLDPCRPGTVPLAPLTQETVLPLAAALNAEDRA